MKYGIFFVAIFTYALFITGYAHADEKQVLSVTPPLFQLSVMPGDIWQSSIKVVNGNPYPLTVYAEVVNFQAVGEEGRGKFLTLAESGGENTTFGEWIQMPQGPFTIPPEQTQDIQFFAEIPQNASPGGHYAAVLISTEPPKETNEIAVRTSQAVTSLLFLRVEGDVHEVGTIREFRVNDSFLDTPDASFSLRFENKGNVHIIPRGNIVITNMWGTERGNIPVNYQTHFGNVLPGTIRDFSFSWKSDFRFTDIGRYKAVATLAYGDERNMKNSSDTNAVTYFWVIPVKWTLITILSIAVFVGLIVFMVRAYVRRMLELAGVEVRGATREEEQTNDAKPLRMQRTYARATAPLQKGVLDLRSQLTSGERSQSTFATIRHFVAQYKWFFISLTSLILMFVAISLYIQNATENRAYEVTIEGKDNASTVLSDTDLDTLVE